MSVEGLKSVFDIGTVVAAFLVFMFGAGVLITGNIINKRQAEQLRQFTNDLKDKDVKIAQADLARAKIEESIAWRRLTKSQQAEIASSLRRFEGNTASLWFGAGDKESETFAMEIATALHGARWRVFKPATLIELSGSGLPFTEAANGSETGVSVSGSANDAGRALADTIVHELTGRGFDAFRAEDSRRPKPDDATVRIEVNVRPQGPQGEAKLRSLAKQ